MIPAQLMQKVGHLDFGSALQFTNGSKLSQQPGSSQVPWSGSSPDLFGPSGRVWAFVSASKGPFTTKLPVY